MLHGAWTSLMYTTSFYYTKCNHRKIKITYLFKIKIKWKHTCFKPVWHKIFWRRFQLFTCLWVTGVKKNSVLLIDFYCMDKNKEHRVVFQYIYLFLFLFKKKNLWSTEKRKSYRVGTTWGRANNDRIFILGQTIPLAYNNWKYREIQLIVCKHYKNVF